MAALKKGLCSFALALAIASPRQCVAESSETRYVVAHWHVPMPYDKGQTEMERAKDDVRAAMEEGLDGFALNAFWGDQAEFLLKLYTTAADLVGATKFKVFLSADMSMKFTAADIVRVVSDFGDNSHYLKIKGKPLLSTYGGENPAGFQWETGVLKPLQAKGHAVTFVPYFDRANPNGDEPSYANWSKVIHSYPFADGLFNFLLPGSLPFYSKDRNIGHHWWSTLEGEESLSKALHDQDKIFIAPYMPYYWAACHSVRQYLEYQGGKGMDNAWRSIISTQKPEVVEIVTWNDYSESTYIQPTRIPMTQVQGIPSYPHLGYYELLKYYLSWIHAGKPPAICKDAVFFFYRPIIRDKTRGATDRLCRMGAVVDDQLWGRINNSIYLTAALTMPAKIRVTSGTSTFIYDAKAGISTLEVPLLPGSQFFEVLRDGKSLVSATGIDSQLDSGGDNFNVYAGYAIAGGSNDQKWHPSDNWKSNSSIEWFGS